MTEKIEELRAAVDAAFNAWADNSVDMPWPAVFNALAVVGEEMEKLREELTEATEAAPTPSDPGAVSDVGALEEEAQGWSTDDRRGSASYTQGLLNRLAAALSNSPRRLGEADVEGIARAICERHSGAALLDWEWRCKHHPRLVEELRNDARAVIAHINASRDNEPPEWMTIDQINTDREPGND